MKQNKYLLAALTITFSFAAYAADVSPKYSQVCGTLSVGCPSDSISAECVFEGHLTTGEGLQTKTIKITPIYAAVKQYLESLTPGVNLSNQCAFGILSVDGESMAVGNLTGMASTTPIDASVASAQASNGRVDWGGPGGFGPMHECTDVDSAGVKYTVTDHLAFGPCEQAHDKCQKESTVPYSCAVQQ